MAWLPIGEVRLVTGLVKDSLLGCMGQVLQWGLQQVKEPEVGQGVDGGWWKVTEGGLGRRLQVEGSDKRM